MVLKPSANLRPGDIIEFEVLKRQNGSDVASYAMTLVKRRIVTVRCVSEYHLSSDVSKYVDVIGKGVPVTKRFSVVDYAQVFQFTTEEEEMGKRSAGADA